MHKKEIGTNSESIVSTNEERKGKPRIKNEIDDDGFTVIKKKK